MATTATFNLRSFVFVLWIAVTVMAGCSTEEPPPSGDVIDVGGDSDPGDTTANDMDGSTDTAEKTDSVTDDVSDASDVHDVEETQIPDPCEGETYESLRGQCTYRAQIRCEFGVRACSFDPYAEGIDFCDCEPIGGASDDWVWRCGNECNL